MKEFVTSRLVLPGEKVSMASVNSCKFYLSFCKDELNFFSLSNISLHCKRSVFNLLLNSTFASAFLLYPTTTFLFNARCKGEPTAR